MRTTLPSFAGLSPRSDARMAFSIAPISDGSNGCATISAGSGTDSVATWLIGILRAVGLDLNAVEQADGGAAGAHAAPCPGARGRWRRPCASSLR